jgi:mitogen-activated protein kinase kinase kinase
VLEGLKFLHGEGVAHKDLKSNNVLMFNDEAVKLTDYALAELYDARLTDQGKMKGRAEIGFSRGDSLPYMAPEVIKNQGFSEKADVWSVGCILVEMMTGKVPWSNLANTFEESFKTIAAAVYPPLPTTVTK